MSAGDTGVPVAQLRLDESLRRHFGPVVLEALEDSRTTDLLLNPNGTLWQARLGEPMHPIGEMSPAQAEMALRTLAAALNTTITSDKPWLEGVFPLDGSRIAGQIPPVVTAPVFAIRKRAVALYSLNHYVDTGILTAEQKASILDAVDAHQNILIVGGTGSGKTTLTNAIIQAIVDSCPDERLLLLEDTGEIQCRAGVQHRPGTDRSGCLVDGRRCGSRHGRSQFRTGRRRLLHQRRRGDGRGPIISRTSRPAGPEAHSISRLRRPDRDGQHPGSLFGESAGTRLRERPPAVAEHAESGGSPAHLDDLDR